MSPRGALAGVLVLVLVLVLACERRPNEAASAAAQVPAREPSLEPSPEPQSEVDAELRETIDALAAESMTVNRVMGVSLALVDGDTIAWATGWGMADRERGLAAGPKTVYAVGSLTKPITAFALLQAVERGELQLDASLAELVPELELADAAASRITLEDLLTHQSGLPSDWFVHDLSADPPPWTDIVGELRGTALSWPPRTVSVYSNLGMTLAGVALGRLDGRSYEARIRDQLLGPAGMDSAYFPGPERDSPPTHAAAYAGDDAAVDPLFRMVPAGGLHASVLDLAAFARVLLAEGRAGSRQLLGPALVEAMMRPPASAPALDLDEHYGYAWVLGHHELDWAGRVALHRGRTFHHHALLIVLPDHDLAVAVAANSLGAAGVIESLAVETLLLALLSSRGLEAPSPPVTPDPPAVSPERLDAFLTAHGGDYVTSMGLATVEAVEGQVRTRERAGNQRIELVDGDGGLLPAMPGRRIAFRELAGYHAMTMLRAGRWRRAAVRLGPPAPIPPAWQARLGTWAPRVRPGEFTTVSELELRVVEGRLRLEFFARFVDPPMPIVLVLEPLDDHRARVAGLARGQGDVIEAIIVDGQPRLRWSGSELEPVAAAQASGP